jgi:guanylate kinase
LNDTGSAARGGGASGAGSLLIVSAPSGAGKTTLCRRLLAEVPGIDFSVSHTTRAPRPGEREGVDYHFVARERFEALVASGELLEWATVAGHLYGTSAAAVRDARSRGRDVLLDIDTQGAASVRRLEPEAVHIFILPPDPEALRTRLEGRGGDTPETIARRLTLARGEIEQAHLYDYLIVNDDIDEAFERLRAVVLSVRCRRGRQAERLRSIAAHFGVAGA